jgi:hypothetical protein
MTATIATVLKPIAGQAVDGIRSDHKFHSIGMIVPASIIGQLCGFHTDLVPGHNAAGWIGIGLDFLCHRINYVKLLISDITAAAHDLIYELHNLHAGRHRYSLALLLTLLLAGLLACAVGFCMGTLLLSVVPCRLSVASPSVTGANSITYSSGTSYLRLGSLGSDRRR